MLEHAKETDVDKTSCKNSYVFIRNNESRLQLNGTFEKPSKLKVCPGLTYEEI